jgi:hypothetical protein
LGAVGFSVAFILTLCISIIQPSLQLLLQI